MPIQFNPPPPRPVRNTSCLVYAMEPQNTIQLWDRARAHVKTNFIVVSGFSELTKPETPPRDIPACTIDCTL
jgi:hypothetical protein